MRFLRAVILLLMACDIVAAEELPLPRPRPAQIAPAAESELSGKPDEPPSACRMRLGTDLAIAPSVVLDGPGECAVGDTVRLEAVVQADKTRVAVTPPAILRCGFAEAIAHWVRDDVAPAVRSLGAALESIDNYASYDCRGRNRVAGAKLSEHGKANALDVRSLRLANGAVVGLTDPHVARELRERLRKGACARFSTVLGPGSDGYHEDHVHVDLVERSSGYRMCQWDVREPGEAPATGADAVPLPRPRPVMPGRTMMLRAFPVGCCSARHGHSRR